MITALTWNAKDTGSNYFLKGLESTQPHESPTARVEGILGWDFNLRIEAIPLCISTYELVGMETGT